MITSMYVACANRTRQAGVSASHLITRRLPMRSTRGDEISCTDEQAAEAVYLRPRSNEALISRTVAEH